MAEFHYSSIFVRQNPDGTYRMVDGPRGTVPPAPTAPPPRPAPAPTPTLRQPEQRRFPDNTPVRLLRHSDGRPPADNGWTYWACHMGRNSIFATQAEPEKVWRGAVAASDDQQLLAERIDWPGLTPTAAQAPTCTTIDPVTLINRALAETRAVWIGPKAPLRTGQCAYYGDDNAGIKHGNRPPELYTDADGALYLRGYFWTGQSECKGDALTRPPLRLELRSEAAPGFFLTPRGRVLAEFNAQIVYVAQDDTANPTRPFLITYESRGPVTLTNADGTKTVIE